MGGNYFYWQAEDLVSIFFISLQKFAINCGNTAKKQNKTLKNGQKKYSCVYNDWCSADNLFHTEPADTRGD